MTQTLQKELESARNEIKNDKIQKLSQKFSHIIRRRKQFQDILTKRDNSKGSTQR